MPPREFSPCLAASETRVAAPRNPAFRSVLWVALLLPLLAGLTAACFDGPPPTPVAESPWPPAPSAIAQAQPPAAPTQTPASKPAGYFPGAEHGIALLQTSRQTSRTRDGWVDVTLTLATLKFDGDIHDRKQRVEANSVCYVNRQPPDDCLLVAWGSKEQFEAELRAFHPVSDSGLPFKTDILVVTFEVAANATRASLYFGNQQRIPLDLQEDESGISSHSGRMALPVPNPAAGPAAGYFVDGDYGVAVTGVRRKPFQPYPTLSLIDVNLALMTLRGGDALAPEVGLHIGDNLDLCPGSGREAVCLEVRWGSENQFQAAPLLWEEGLVPWPRGNGLPRSFSFVVPDSAGRAVIEFGEQRIPLNLGDITGKAPPYHYGMHYPELPAGTTLYDSSRKTVALHEVVQEAASGSVRLVFRARNDSEATDFAPVIQVSGSRVSESGVFFDKTLSPTAGWIPETVRIEGRKLAPGQSSLMEHVIPRVAGESQGHWQLVRYSPDAEDRPDGVVLQLGVSDSQADSVPAVSKAGYIRYDRTLEESAYWPGTRLWRYRAGDLRSSPVVTDGVVYAGSFDNHLYALDALTGGVLWSFRADGRLSRPAVSGGAVYAGSSDNHLYALDADTGGLLWRYETGDRVFGPAVAGGMVYAGSSDEHLYALDAATGRLLWSYYSILLPAVSGNMVYASSQGNYLYALDAVTGNQVWRHRAGGRLSRPLASGDAVYAGSLDRSLYALDAATGRLLWRHETGGIVYTPAVSGGVVYAGSADSWLYALDMATGRLLWRYKAGDRVSTPAVSDGVVYVGSGDEHLYALDAATGELLWRHKTGGRVHTPAVSEGVVYAGSSDNHLYAIAASPRD